MSIDQAAIEEEITRALPRERGIGSQPGRLEIARKNDLYYQGDFKEDTDPWDYPEWGLVTVRLMRRVIELLTANLYRAGPIRTWPRLENASTGLGTIYTANAADALWQEADRLCLVNGVTCWQVNPNLGDDWQQRPFKFLLWGANSFSVWPDSEDARTPGAVAVMDVDGDRRRLRLWTEDETVTYHTPALNAQATSGGASYRETDRAMNPWGFLPFAFAHAEFPAREFWTPSPGAMLRGLNLVVNRRLTMANDDAINLRPKGVVEGVVGDWQFPVKQKAGEFISVPSIADAAGTIAGDPRVSYVTCDFGYLETDLSTLQGLLDRALESLGIPGSAIRMEQTSTQSGVALISEQIPLVQWAEGRQRPFSWYEQQLARLVARMAAVQCRESGLGDLAGATADEWEAASYESLQLRWPSMAPDLPGQQRDQTDQWLLDNQLTSRQRILQHRLKITEEEAEEQVQQIADELAREAQLLAPVYQAQMAATQPPAAPPEDMTQYDEEEQPDATDDPNHEAASGIEP